ncbi:Rqc2 family fibronectin-binding protein [Paraliobacillus salinarum]|uniref:Rqc2 family fibronectin-binding protein n=1 Tax=Paraliobacillus salinarum TaxID=1158996 RepID=UPI0015F6BF09|nr:NFACT RNA binding domain-containing protein [Paraliobacillus salinarum]
MTFDGVVTRAMTRELQQNIETGRVLKIYQPTQTELILTIRTQGKNKSLLLSAHPSYARFHLTEDIYQNPTEPPMFCMLLRKHLAGGFIEAVEQHENERVVFFSFKVRNEIGDETRKTLVMEVMGKHSNIILIDQDKGHVLDSIKHVSPSQSRHRTVLPGQPYILPPNQGKTNPLSTETDAFRKKLDLNAGKIDQQIVESFMGISPLLAKEIVHRANLGSLTDYETAFNQLMSSINEDNFEPCIYQNKKEDFYVLPLTHIKSEKNLFASTSIMLDAFYSGKAERDRVKQQAGDLLRLLKNEIDKNKRKIKKQEQTLKKAEKADDYQRYGELLTAHMHNISSGDKEAVVLNYYDPEQKEITIPLDPNKTPSQNTQAYFKTYQKLKTSKVKVEIEIQKAEQEILYLEEIMQQIEVAREQDIEEIRDELKEQGYIRKRAKARKKNNKPKKPEPEKFMSSDGTTIYVGRNNKQNEYLTTRLAARTDIWLHTKDIPGSHVVIRGNTPSEETLAEASQLAALFSKAKSSSSVPVDYTEIRYVKKPNGAKPGYVTYDNQKTLFVTPNESFLNSLKKLK